MADRYDRPVPEAAFVIAPEAPGRVRELADTLAFELGLQGVPSSVHDDFVASRPDRVHVLIDPAAHVARTGAELPDDGVLRRTVMICEEAPPSDQTDPAWSRLNRAGAVFTLDASDRARLIRLEIAARLLRPGYSRFLDHFDITAEREVDVAFVGAQSARRTRMLADAARVLDRHECQIQWLSDSPPSAEPDPPGWRTTLLAQTKILILLHLDDKHLRLQWRDAVEAIHAGAVVVSEHSAGIAPLVAGEHLLVGGPQALPYLAETLLRDPGRLDALRLAAYERVRDWVPYALPVSVLRAAIVELVGEPEVQPGESRGA